MDVTQTPVETIRRIDISVRPADAKEDSSLASVTRFLRHGGRTARLHAGCLARRSATARRPGKATRTTRSNRRRISRRTEDDPPEPEEPPHEPIRAIRRSSMKCRIMRARGFTLLEVLVAVVDLRHHQRARLWRLQPADPTERHRRAQRRRARARSSRPMQRMTEDFAMLEPRPIREPLGESLEPALRAGTRVPRRSPISRARAGRNPAGVLALDVAAGHVSPGEQQAASAPTGTRSTAR